ncbi:unnamed protein product [Hyaloperonospora brassicae]|uniref:Uncharacterized protein n=1 Tax=Hyaloperonospora brassicae TaxID=162125 RepID=A0AAV0TVK3_HYABA|nr:unnamed protein product [Hyaloperonospora brassicae]
MNLVIVLQSVRSEREANNLPRTQDAPPVLPTQLVKLLPQMLLRMTYDEDDKLRAVEINPNRTCLIHPSLKGIFQTNHRGVLDTLTQRMAQT